MRFRAKYTSAPAMPVGGVNMGREYWIGWSEGLNGPGVDWPGLGKLVSPGVASI